MIADIDGLGPYFQPADTIHVGRRNEDEHLAEVRGWLAKAIPASAIVDDGALAVAQAIRAELDTSHLAGYWLHLDVDILDPNIMPAVDSADPGGLDADQVTHLLAALAPDAVGADATIFDPDLDPDGIYARRIVDILVEGLNGVMGERSS